jgi:3-oxoacyl-[acyl-carrier-protein] synthase-3
MATLCFEDIGISALSAAIPAKIIDNLSYSDYFSPEEAKLVVEKIGVYNRRFAESGVCSSDLCFAAAEKLITDNYINKDEIDLLVFISQTPDYRMPATSIILQDRLGLTHDTVAFDINLGCSGFIYGLAIVYSMMDGETRSRVYSPKDRQAAFLFGDGGAAALIKRSKKFKKSYFSLNSDGSKEDLIKIKAGGYRYPPSSDTNLEHIVDEYGNIRSDEHGYIRGSEVFTFVAKEVPRDIRKILDFSGYRIEDIDYFILHQANMFINNHLIKKLKLDSAKVPSTIDKFGNTSSVSIPLTIVSELQGKISNKKILFSGFGVGMTWASCVIDTGACRISDLIEI